MARGSKHFKGPVSVYPWVAPPWWYIIRVRVYPERIIGLPGCVDCIGAARASLLVVVVVVAQRSAASIVGGTYTIKYKESF